MCERYYKPVAVKYYIVDCVKWVPRLTLELEFTHALSEWNSFVCEGLAVLPCIVNALGSMFLHCLCILIFSIILDLKISKQIYSSHNPTTIY